jgi:hypothetical protein
LDYPELNLLVGVALAITLGIALSLVSLVNRLEYPSALKYVLKVLVELGLIAAGYAFLLLFPSMSLFYQVRLVLSLLVIAGIAILAVIRLRRLAYSWPQRGVLVALLVASLGLIGWLVFVLIRSLIPSTTAILILTLMDNNSTAFGFSRYQYGG